MTSPLDNIRVVLTAPIYGGNVGSVCRAMGNMGVSDLVIAAPEPLDHDDVLRMACAAAPIYHGRRETATLRDAVEDCIRVAGTSAREGLYRSHSWTPRDAANELLQSTAHGKVALVFGRETHGLSNAELALCTDILKIPTGPAVTSLNISQAVMVCLYELFIQAGEYQAPLEPSPTATSELRERMLDIWQQALLEIGFMKPDKVMHNMLGIRRIFSRGQLSVNDVRILMGIGRQMIWSATRRDAPAGTAPSARAGETGAPLTDRFATPDLPDDRMTEFQGHERTRCSPD